MIVHVKVCGQIFALLDSGSLHTIKDRLLGSGELPCERPAWLNSVINARRELVYKGESGKLTGHLAVKELQLVEPLNAL